MSKPPKDTTLDRFWDIPLKDLLAQLQATPAGLTSDEARQRLRQHGPNSLVGESRFAALTALFSFFANPLVVILLAAAAISIVLGDAVGGSIIIAIVLLSVVVNFYVEFQARHAVEDIRKQVATTAAVLRDGHEVELPTGQLVALEHCGGQLAVVPKRAPTPAVNPMAKAPQNVTRTAPTLTPAPPTRAANPPKNARNNNDVPATRGISPATGATAVTSSGMDAPTEKLAADANAA